jgi:hypothetical protein
MSRLSFRDRFFSPPVARAMTSPSAILLAGGGAAVAIAGGLPLLAAPFIGALAWGGRVLAAVPRAPRQERIDPFTVNEPWRRFVQEALQARSRFDEAVRRAEPGPLRDRLGEIGTRIDDGVQQVWQIARRGQSLAQARRGLDPVEIQRQLAEVEADASQPWAAGSALERAAEALRAQLATVERMDRVIGEAHSKLRLLDARLDEAVARTLELSVRAYDPAALGGVGADVDGVVTEMEALRQALEETGGGPGGSAAGGLPSPGPG